MLDRQHLSSSGDEYLATFCHGYETEPHLAAMGSRSQQARTRAHLATQQGIRRGLQRHVSPDETASFQEGTRGFRNLHGRGGSI